MEKLQVKEEQRVLNKLHGKIAGQGGGATINKIGRQQD